MRDLILAIKKQLQDELDYIRERDIYITPHIGFIPQGAMYPCIGIKVGKNEHSYGAGHSKENEQYVRLAIFQDLAREELSIIGDSGSNVKGLLEINEECIEALENKKLGVPGVISAIVVADPEADFFDDGNGSEIQRKQLGFKYERQTHS